MINEKKLAFQQNVAMLDALSPLKVMERGYSLLYSEDDTIIKTVQSVEKGDRIRVQMTDGSIYAHVDLIGGKKDEN
jgi:exodeoxyribonuclease VII large subunit